MQGNKKETWGNIFEFRIWGKEQDTNLWLWYNVCLRRRAVEAGHCLDKMGLETPPSLRTLPQSQPLNQFVCQNAHFNVLVSSLNHDFENRQTSHNPIFRINTTPYSTSFIFGQNGGYFCRFVLATLCWPKIPILKKFFSVRRLFANFGFT